ncbi:Uncharacterised protein [Moraxella lacunata]|uniref:Ion transport domain-containing protein n=1 Tax=Moraxella lacunata TaxID=477 RepID=A0A378QGL5_MORLA|nr:hypothetical protein [Moraxella lacunata]STZ00047.1 Uncharacterised protein [Moraxella lacunata]
MSIRQKLYILLENHDDSSPLALPAKILDLFLITLILLNTLAVILESVDSIY